MSLQHEAELQFPFVKTSLVDVTNKLPFKPPCKILFKNESEQPCGSFKLRGIGNLVGRSVVKSRSINPNKKIRIFASSGGNAGIAAAYSAEFYNIGCTVAVPNSTKAVVLEKLKSYNADVIIFGDSINEADKYLRTQMALYGDDIEKVYCHPFENELVWEGHASLVDEINESSNVENESIRGVVCSIGGGGLYNGIYQGLQNHQISSDILLVETKQAPTFVETIKRKEIFTLDNVKSVATSLACSYLSKRSLDIYMNQTDINRTKVAPIDDMDAIKACLQYYDVFGAPIEPACGAAVSVVLNRLDLLLHNFDNLTPNDTIVVVVCGGSCTDEAGIEEFRQLVGQAKF